MKPIEDCFCWHIRIRKWQFFMSLHSDWEKLRAIKDGSHYYGTHFVNMIISYWLPCLCLIAPKELRDIYLSSYQICAAVRKRGTNFVQTHVNVKPRKSTYKAFFTNVMKFSNRFSFKFKVQIFIFHLIADTFTVKFHKGKVLHWVFFRIRIM